MEFFCGPSASSSSSSSAARRPRASAGTTSSSSSSRDESRQWPRSSLPPRPQAPPARNDRASAAEKTASRHSQPHKSTTNGRPSSYAPAPHRAEFAPGAGTNSSSASSSSSSTSSRSNAASASASSSTHPSPSTSNSLRTPPDVAPRGLSSSAVGGNATKVGNINNKRHTLTMAEIDQRLKLIDTLAGDIDVSIPALPRPGGTAKPEAAAAAAAAPSSSAMSRAGSSDSKQTRLASTSSSSTSKKRAGQDQKDIAEEDGSIEPPRKKTRARASTNRDYTPSPSPEPKVKVTAVAKTTPASSPAQKPAAWTKDKLSSAASYYQSKARSLKHSSDRTLREAVAPDSASVLAQRQAAVFGQTDAVLLYVYAFWCEDALATLNAGSSVDGPTVIVSNWRSMLDLVKFVAAKHERRREWALAALCHLVEGLLLRHISAYESRQVQRNLSRLAAASATASATSAAHSPAGEAPSPAARSDGTMTTAASPPVTTVSNATDVHGALVDLSTNLARVLRDEAWGTKLVAQARSSSSSSSSSSASSSTTPVGALSNTSLARDFPQTWATCLRGALVRGDAWSSAPSMNPAAFSKGRDDDREEGEADEEQGDGAAVWAWPFIEASGAAGAPGAAQSSDEATRLAHSLPGACLPHLVCFGRSLLRERAARTGLKEFRLADLDEPPATSGRNGK